MAGSQNAIWSYVTVVRGPALGPTPHLAQSSGKTGKSSAPGRDGQLPGFMSEQTEYQPEGYDYSPDWNDTFTARVPRSIGVGDDGLLALNPTYRAHDFTPAERQLGGLRSADNWQDMQFPGDFRPLVDRQQVNIYNLMSQVREARILSRNDYFFGYQVDPSVASQLGGGNSMGTLGNS